MVRVYRRLNEIKKGVVAMWNRYTKRTRTVPTGKTSYVDIVEDRRTMGQFTGLRMIHFSWMVAVAGILNNVSGMCRSLSRKIQ